MPDQLKTTQLRRRDASRRWERVVAVGFHEYVNNLCKVTRRYLYYAMPNKTRQERWETVHFCVFRIFNLQKCIFFFFFVCNNVKRERNRVAAQERRNAKEEVKNWIVKTLHGNEVTVSLQGEKWDTRWICMHSVWGARQHSKGWRGAASNFKCQIVAVYTSSGESSLPLILIIYNFICIHMYTNHEYIYTIEAPY